MHIHPLPDFGDVLLFFTSLDQTRDVLVIHKQGSDALRGISDKAAVKEIKRCAKRLGAAARRKGKPSVLTQVDPKLGFVALIRDNTANETIPIDPSRGPVSGNVIVVPRLIAYLLKASPPAERLRRLERYVVAVVNAREAQGDQKPLQSGSGAFAQNPTWSGPFS